MHNTPEYYVAPMEGVTDIHFRKLHHSFFPEADRYYSPFLSPSEERLLTPKELAEIDPMANEGMVLIPQLLTNRWDLFVGAAGQLASMGYPLVNLNLGCPSGTVVSKKRGAGFLSDPEGLDRFFYQVFSAPTADSFRVSVKTRLGVHDPEEFYRLAEIYVSYPFEEIILHPRTKDQMYSGKALPDFYELLRKKVQELPDGRQKPRLVMNGDLFTCSLAEEFDRTVGADDALMFGRGLIANPALIRQMKGGTGLTKQEMKEFAQTVYARTREIMNGSERNTLFAMKEYWYYWSRLFSPSDKAVKPIRKAQRLTDYESAVRNVFAAFEFRPESVTF